MKVLLLETFAYFIFFFSFYKLAYWFKQRKNKDVLYQIMEVVYLSQKYKLDIHKIGINKVLNVIALVNSLIFTLTLLVTTNIDNFMVRLLIMFIILLPAIFIGYHFVGRYFQKRGMKKNV